MGQGDGKERRAHTVYSGINQFELSLTDEEELPLTKESRGDRTLEEEE